MSTLCEADKHSMANAQPPLSKPFILDTGGLDHLIRTLLSQGYQVLGPTVSDGAIVYQRVSSADDLPAGWTDQQQGGRYRTHRRSDGALFGHVVGPPSWKKFLYPPARRLWHAQRKAKGFRLIPEEPAAHKFAFLGVRSCDLHALAVQDRVFLQGPYVDSDYFARRQNLFIVAVNCTQPGGNCFCASMETGPRVSSGYDLALTELLHDGDRNGRNVDTTLMVAPRVLIFDNLGLCGEYARVTMSRNSAFQGAQLPRSELRGNFASCSRKAPMPS